MSRQKRYTISLGVRGPDGRRFASRIKAIPIGSSDISLASFWMLLDANLKATLPMVGLKDQDFSPKDQVRGLKT